MSLFGRPQSPVPPHRVIPPHPPATLAPSLPSAYQGTIGTQVLLPGADFPPAGAIPVDQPADANLAPGTVNFALVSVSVPPNLRFRMAGIGFGADDEVALRFLTWSVRFNGDPAPSGYSAQPAAIGSIRQLADIFLVAGASILVTINVTIDPTAALTYRYICRLRGWFYTESSGGQ